MFKDICYIWSSFKITQTASEVKKNKKNFLTKYVHILLLYFTKGLCMLGYAQLLHPTVYNCSNLLVGYMNNSNPACVAIHSVSWF